MPAAGNDRPDSWRAACRALAEAVRQAPPDASFVRRVEVPAPIGIDLLDWLAAQPAPRGYWEERDDEASYAFTGVADRFEEPVRLVASLTQHARGRPGEALRYYGGMRFDPRRRAAGGWQGFGDGAFVLPRFELARREGDTVRLACHLMPDDDVEAVARQAERPVLSSVSGHSVRTLPKVIQRRDTPGEQAWRRSVQQALHDIARGALHKVVLARRTTFSFGGPLDPVLLLRHLYAAAPKGYVFLLQPARAGGYLGVSPERLFRQRGRRVRSEAVAGTRPRAEAAEADAVLQEELLQSEKDRREHAYVQQYVREGLRPLSVSLREHETGSLTLRRGRHLYARLEGHLREEVSPAEVLRTLHPTPAVGGLPVKAAQRFIREQEPFDRGWYAGPVGWMGTADGTLAAELAVGIRSGLVHASERRLDLFAGAGLVEGSRAEAEWNEVEQKLGNFAALFE